MLVAFSWMKIWLPGVDSLRNLFQVPTAELCSALQQLSDAVLRDITELKKPPPQVWRTGSNTARICALPFRPGFRADGFG